MEDPATVNSTVSILSKWAPILIALLSLAVSLWFFWIQRKHNRLSVKPILTLVKGDYEDNIFVKLRNKGFGPLIIENIKVFKEDDNKSSNIMDFMPNLPEGKSWSGFSGVLDNVVLSPNEERILVGYTPESENKEEEKIKYDIRNNLKDIKINIKYKDIYNTVYYEYLELSWFGRLLSR